MTTSNEIRQHHLRDVGMYILRVLQLIFGLATLGVTGNEVSDWTSASCSAPDRLNYNIAVAALVLPAMIYLLLCTGPAANRIRCLPWSIWVQFVIDGLFLIFFLAAGALWAKGFTCSDYERLCSGYCPDYSSDYKLRLLKRSSLSSLGKIGGKAYETSTKLGLDWFMFILFLITFIWTCSIIYKSVFRTGSNTTHTSTTNYPATSEVPNAENQHPINPNTTHHV